MARNRRLDQRRLLEEVPVTQCMTQRDSGGLEHHSMSPTALPRSKDMSAFLWHHALSLSFSLSLTHSLAPHSISVSVCLSDSVSVSLPLASYFPLSPDDFGSSASPSQALRKSANRCKRWDHALFSNSKQNDAVAHRFSWSQSLTVQSADAETKMRG